MGISILIDKKERLSYGETCLFTERAEGASLINYLLTRVECRVYITVICSINDTTQPTKKKYQKNNIDIAVEELTAIANRLRLTAEFGMLRPKSKKK